MRRLLVLQGRNLLFLLLGLCCLVIGLGIVELNLMGGFLCIIYGRFLRLLGEGLGIGLGLGLLFGVGVFEVGIVGGLLLLVVGGFLGRGLGLEVGLLRLGLMGRL